MFFRAILAVALLLCLICFLELEFLDRLPGKVGIFTSKMSIRGRFAHNGTTQIQVTNDASGSQIKILVDDFHQVGIIHTLLDRAVRIDVDGQRVRNADRIRQLHEAATAELGRHERLGDPTGSVGGRAIDLGRVLARKGSTAVRTPTTVRVDNDFATRQASIAVRSANDKATARIQVVNRLVVQVLFRNNGLDDVFHEIGLDLFLRHVFAVLRRNDNGMDAFRHRHAIFEHVFARDLRLAVRAHPFARAILAHLRQLVANLRRQHVRERHKHGRFIGGVAKHDALIASANFLNIRRIDTLRNIRRLFFNGNNNVARLVIKALGGIVITNILDRVANDLFVIDRGGRGDFAKNHHHARLGAGFARDARHFIAGDARVEDSIRHLIAKLVCVCE
jgi:hypothetical protein